MSLFSFAHFSNRILFLLRLFFIQFFFDDLFVNDSRFDFSLNKNWNVNGVSLLSLLQSSNHKNKLSLLSQIRNIKRSIKIKLTKTFVFWLDNYITVLLCFIFVCLVSFLRIQLFRYSTYASVPNTFNPYEKSSFVPLMKKEQNRFFFQTVVELYHICQCTNWFSGLHKILNFNSFSRLFFITMHLQEKERNFGFLFLLTFVI